MITIKEPPRSSDYVIQMLSETGEWMDVVTGLGRRDNAMITLGRWRLIHPGREFRPVKRMITDEVIPG